MDQKNSCIHIWATCAKRFRLLLKVIKIREDYDKQRAGQTSFNFDDVPEPELVESLELYPCGICGRTFQPKALDKHEQICQKQASKKRKPFNSLAQRVAGTDLADFHMKTYLKKPGNEKSPYLKEEEPVKALKTLKNYFKTSSPTLHHANFKHPESFLKGSEYIDQNTPQVVETFAPQKLEQIVVEEPVRGKEKTFHKSPTKKKEKHRSSEEPLRGNERCREKSPIKSEKMKVKEEPPIRGQDKVERTPRRRKEKSPEEIIRAQHSTVTPKRSTSSMRGTANTPQGEKCPHCDRTFGLKAYERHVEWCKGRQPRMQQSPAGLQMAKERLAARTNYRAPIRSKSQRAINKEKYSSLKSDSKTSLKRDSSVEDSIEIPNNPIHFQKDSRCEEPRKNNSRKPSPTHRSHTSQKDEYARSHHHKSYRNKSPTNISPKQHDDTNIETPGRTHRKSFGNSTSTQQYSCENETHEKGSNRKLSHQNSRESSDGTPIMSGLSPSGSSSPDMLSTMEDNEAARLTPQQLRINKKTKFGTKPLKINDVVVNKLALGMTVTSYGNPNGKFLSKRDNVLCQNMDSSKQSIESIPSGIPRKVGLNKAKENLTKSSPSKIDLIKKNIDKFNSQSNSSKRFVPRRSEIPVKRKAVLAKDVEKALKEFKSKMITNVEMQGPEFETIEESLRKEFNDEDELLQNQSTVSVINIQEHNNKNDFCNEFYDKEVSKSSTSSKSEENEYKISSIEEHDSSMRNSFTNSSSLERDVEMYAKTFSDACSDYDSFVKYINQDELQPVEEGNKEEDRIEEVDLQDEYDFIEIDGRICMQKKIEDIHSIGETEENKEFNFVMDRQEESMFNFNRNSTFSDSRPTKNVGESTTNFSKSPRHSPRCHLSKEPVSRASRTSSPIHLKRNEHNLQYENSSISNEIGILKRNSSDSTWTSSSENSFIDVKTTVAKSAVVLNKIINLPIDKYANDLDYVCTDRSLSDGKLSEDKSKSTSPRSSSTFLSIADSHETFNISDNEDSHRYGNNVDLDIIDEIPDIPEIPTIFIDLDENKPEDVSNSTDQSERYRTMKEEVDLMKRPVCDKNLIKSCTVRSSSKTDRINRDIGESLETNSGDIWEWKNNSFSLNSKPKVIHVMSAYSEPVDDRPTRSLSAHTVGDSRNFVNKENLSIEVLKENFSITEESNADSHTLHLCKSKNYINITGENLESSNTILDLEYHKVDSGFNSKPISIEYNLEFNEKKNFLSVKSIEDDKQETRINEGILDSSELSVKEVPVVCEIETIHIVNEETSCVNEDCSKDLKKIFGDYRNESRPCKTAVLGRSKKEIVTEPNNHEFVCNEPNTCFDSPSQNTFTLPESTTFNYHHTSKQTSQINVCSTFTKNTEMISVLNDQASSTISDFCKSIKTDMNCSTKHAAMSDDTFGKDQTNFYQFNNTGECSKIVFNQIWSNSPSVVTRPDANTETSNTQFCFDPEKFKHINFNVRVVTPEKYTTTPSPIATPTKRLSSESLLDGTKIVPCKRRRLDDSNYDYLSASKTNIDNTLYDIDLESRLELNSFTNLSSSESYNSSEKKTEYDLHLVSSEENFCMLTSNQNLEDTERVSILQNNSIPCTQSTIEEEIISPKSSDCDSLTLAEKLKQNVTSSSLDNTSVGDSMTGDVVSPRLSNANDFEKVNCMPSDQTDNEADMSETPRDGHIVTKGALALQQSYYEMDWNFMYDHRKTSSTESLRIEEITSEIDTNDSLIGNSNLNSNLPVEVLSSLVNDNMPNDENINTSQYVEAKSVDDHCESECNKSVNTNDFPKSDRSSNTLTSRTSSKCFTSTPIKSAALKSPRLKKDSDLKCFSEDEYYLHYKSKHSWKRRKSRQYRNNKQVKKKYFTPQKTITTNLSKKEREEYKNHKSGRSAYSYFHSYVDRDVSDTSSDDLRETLCTVSSKIKSLTSRSARTLRRAKIQQENYYSTDSLDDTSSLLANDSCTNNSGFVPYDTVKEYAESVETRLNDEFISVKKCSKETDKSVHKKKILKLPCVIRNKSGSFTIISGKSDDQLKCQDRKTDNCNIKSPSNTKISLNNATKVRPMNVNALQKKNSNASKIDLNSNIGSNRNELNKTKEKRPIIKRAEVDYVIAKPKICLKKRKFKKIKTTKNSTEIQCGCKSKQCGKNVSKCTDLNSAAVSKANGEKFNMAIKLNKNIIQLPALKRNLSGNARLLGTQKNELGKRLVRSGTLPPLDTSNDPYDPFISARRQLQELFMADTKSTFHPQPVHSTTPIIRPKTAPCIPTVDEQIMARNISSSNLTLPDINQHKTRPSGGIKTTTNKTVGLAKIVRKNSVKRKDSVKERTNNAIEERKNSRTHNANVNYDEIPIVSKYTKTNLTPGIDEKLTSAIDNYKLSPSIDVSIKNDKNSNRSSVIEPPQDFQDQLKLLQDNFEVIENLVNDNFATSIVADPLLSNSKNGEKNSRKLSQKSGVKLENLFTDSIRSDDVFDINPLLINSVDNLSIPDDIQIHNSDVYSDVYDKDISTLEPLVLTKAEKDLKRLACDSDSVGDDFDFDGLISSFDEDEPNVPSLKKFLRQNSIPENESSIFNSSAIISNQPISQKTPNSYLNRSVSVGPAPKSKHVRNKEDEKYLESNEDRKRMDGDRVPVEELFDVDDQLYEEYKQYEQLYLQEKRLAKRESMSNKIGPHGEQPSPGDIFPTEVYKNDTVKPSGDSAYSRSIGKPSPRNQRARTQHKIERDRCPSSSGSDVSLPPVSLGQKSSAIHKAMLNSIGNPQLDLNPSTDNEQLNTKNEKRSSRNSSVDNTGVQLPAFGNSSDGMTTQTVPENNNFETRRSENNSHESSPCPQRLSKFCHECGSKFPVTMAKFCVECGVKRLVL